MSPEIKSKYYTPSQHTVDKSAETEQPDDKPTEGKLTDDKWVDNNNWTTKVYFQFWVVCIGYWPIHFT